MRDNLPFFLRFMRRVTELARFRNQFATQGVAIGVSGLAASIAAGLFLFGARGSVHIV